MTKINTGGPVYPSDCVYVNGVVIPAHTLETGGMSKREVYAGQAMASLIAKAPFFDRKGEHGNPIDVDQFMADICASARAYADALLAALGEGQ